MPGQSDFPAVFASLKKILKVYEPNLVVKHDEPDNYYLNTHYSEKWRKELFFGAVTVKKNYVSFYLMPVYIYPDLLEGLSPELRRHMQGKSCFNFKGIDEALFEELARLADSSVQRVQTEKLV
jgi:hypothetical protein